MDYNKSEKGKGVRIGIEGRGEGKSASPKSHLICKPRRPSQDPTALINLVTDGLPLAQPKEVESQKA